MPIEPQTDHRAAPSDPVVSASSFVPPGLIHWSAQGAVAHLSARAGALLGDPGGESTVPLALLWHRLEPDDRERVSWAVRDLHVGEAPVALAVRIEAFGPEPASWLHIGLEALVPDAGRGFDRVAYVMPATGALPGVGVPGRLVCFDGLTGQPNRLLFRDQVHLAIRRAARDRGLLAVMALDVGLDAADEDTLGRTPASRERLLRAAVLRIGNSLRAEDLVAAHGDVARPLAAGGPAGGGFAVLLPHIREPQDAARVAFRIAEAVSRPVTIDGVTVHPRLSTGIALYPWDDQEVDGLLRCAEQSESRARTLADGRPQFFSKPMNALATDGSISKRICVNPCRTPGSRCATCRGSTGSPVRCWATRRCCAGTIRCGG